MSQNRYSPMDKQRLERILRERGARLDGYLRALDILQARREQATLYTSMYPWEQHTQAAQPLPDDPKIIEGTFFVVDSETEGIYQPGIERIASLRQAVYRRDTRVLGVWVLTIICSYYGQHLLTLVLLGLTALLFYLKLFWAAKVPCPNCQKPFGSSQWLPTRLGGIVCQHCGFSIKPFNISKGGSNK